VATSRVAVIVFPAQTSPSYVFFSAKQICAPPKEGSAFRCLEALQKGFRPSPLAPTKRPRRLGNQLSSKSPAAASSKASPT
jgi:hypothetical protein